MIRAFTEVLGLKEGELIIPKHFASMPAIGIALTRMALPDIEKITWDLSTLEAYLESERGKERKSMPRLSRDSAVDVTPLV